MSAAPSHLPRFEDELAVLLVGRQSCDAAEVRHALFAHLSTLERRALIAGASDSTLRKIAEARFLVGILRDAMRPSRIAPLRSLLRMRVSNGLHAEADLV